MKDKAKALLKNYPLSEIVDNQLDLHIYDYIISILHDNWDNEVRDAILENGDDPSDYDPLYDSWEDLIDSEGENVAYELASYAIKKMNLPDDVLENLNNEVLEEVSGKILEFFNENRQYVFYT